MPTQKRKKPSLAKLKKRADAIFSKYIRIRDNFTCYTCGRVMDLNSSQNGHFVPRQYLSVRYDEVNCHCQCYACNMLYNGQPSAYAARLEKDYGLGTVLNLEAKRKETTLWREKEYNELIDKYTLLVNKMIDEIAF